MCLQRKQLNRGDYLTTKQFRSNSVSAFTVNEGIHVHVQRYIHVIMSCTFGPRFLSLLSERKTKKLPECTKIFYFIPETLSSEFYSRLPKEDTIESYKD